MRVAAQLRHLPARARRLIELSYYKGKTLGKAATEMSFRRSWASRLVARSLVTLRAAIEEQSSYRLADRAFDLGNEIGGSPVGGAR